MKNLSITVIALFLSVSSFANEYSDKKCVMQMFSEEGKIHLTNDLSEKGVKVFDGNCLEIVKLINEYVVVGKDYEAPKQITLDYKNP